MTDMDTSITGLHIDAIDMPPSTAILIDVQDTDAAEDSSDVVYEAFGDVDSATSDEDRTDASKDHATESDTTMVELLRAEMAELRESHGAMLLELRAKVETLEIQQANGKTAARKVGNAGDADHTEKVGGDANERTSKTQQSTQGMKGRRRYRYTHRGVGTGNSLLQIGTRSSQRMKKSIPGFGAIMSAVGDKFDEFANKVITPIKNGLETAIKKVTEFLEGMIKQVRKFAEKALKAITKVINKIKKALTKAIEVMGKGLKSLIKKAIKAVRKVIDKIKEVIHKLRDWVKGWIEKLEAVIKKAIDAVKKAIKDVWEAAKRQITKVTDAIKKGFMKIINTIKKKIMSIVRVIYKKITWVIDQLPKVWDFVKEIGKTLKKVWETIKSLPAMFLKWLTDGFSWLLEQGLEPIFEFIGGSGGSAGSAAFVELGAGSGLGPAKATANKVCRWAQKIPVVKDLCYWPMLAFEVVVGKIMDLTSIAVQFMSDTVKHAIREATGLPVNFGTKGEAETACASYRGFLPLLSVMNIPGYALCHIHARLMFAASDLLDILLSYITKMSTKIPDIGGRTFWATKDGLTFGSKHVAMEDCKSFFKLIGSPKLTVKPAGLVCIVYHRVFSGLRSLGDAFFHHLAALVTVVPFPSIEETADVCASWKTGVFKAFGGVLTHGMFVLCTFVARFFAVFDWATHWAWDKLAGLVNKAAGSKLNAFTFDHARKSCAWKHHGLFGMPGFALRSACQLGLRVFNTVVAVLGKLIGMLFEIFEIQVTAFPPAPDPTCGPILGLISKLPAGATMILNELPLFPIEILCDTSMRLLKYLISVAQGVFTLIDMTLAGVGPVAEVVMDIFGIVFKEARKFMKDVFPALIELDAETQAELDQHGIQDDLKDVSDALKPLAEIGMKIIPMYKQAYDLYHNALPNAMTARLQFYKVCDGDNKKCTTPGGTGKVQKKDQLRLPGSKGAKRCAKTIYQCTPKKPGKGRSVPTPAECGRLRASQRKESSMKASGGFGRFKASDYYIEPKCVIDAAANDVLDDLAGAACDTLEISDEIILLAIINQMNQISASLGSLGKTGADKKKGSNKISDFLCEARAELKKLGPSNIVSVTLCNMPNAVPWSIHDWDEENVGKDVVDREEKDEDTQDTQPIRARVNVHQAGETVYEATYDKAFHLHLKKDTGGILTKIANLESTPSIVREAFNQRLLVSLTQDEHKDWKVSVEMPGAMQVLEDMSELHPIRDKMKEIIGEDVKFGIAIAGKGKMEILGVSLKDLYQRLGVAGKIGMAVGKAVDMVDQAKDAAFDSMGNGAFDPEKEAIAFVEKGVKAYDDGVSLVYDSVARIEDAAKAKVNEGLALARAHTLDRLLGLTAEVRAAAKDGIARQTELTKQGVASVTNILGEVRFTVDDLGTMVMDELDELLEKPREDLMMARTGAETFLKFLQYVPQKFLSKPPFTLAAMNLTLSPKSIEKVIGYIDQAHGILDTITRRVESAVAMVNEFVAKITSNALAEIKQSVDTFLAAGDKLEEALATALARVDTEAKAVYDELVEKIEMVLAVVREKKDQVMGLVKKHIIDRVQPVMDVTVEWLTKIKDAGGLKEIIKGMLEDEALKRVEKSMRNRWFMRPTIMEVYKNGFVPEDRSSVCPNVAAKRYANKLAAKQFATAQKKDGLNQNVKVVNPGSPVAT